SPGAGAAPFVLVEVIDCGNSLLLSPRFLSTVSLPRSELEHEELQEALGVDVDAWLLVPRRVEDAAVAVREADRVGGVVPGLAVGLCRTSDVDTHVRRRGQHDGPRRPELHLEL